MALRDFDHARRLEYGCDLFSRLTANQNKLLTFDALCRTSPFTGQHYRGLQIVPLDSIVGSEGHFADFDAAFFPRRSCTQDHWIRIDQAYYDQFALPPVQLFKVGTLYTVHDGHHRVSFARARKQDFVDAEVIELEVSDPGERSGSGSVLKPPMPTRNQTEKPS